MNELILDHAPRPGPQHWDWRCLTCSEDVQLHGSWLQRWRWRRFRRRLTRPGSRCPQTGHRLGPLGICPKCGWWRTD